MYLQIFPCTANEQPSTQTVYNARLASPQMLIRRCWPCEGLDPVPTGFFYIWAARLHAVRVCYHAHLPFFHIHCEVKCITECIVTCILRYSWSTGISGMGGSGGMQLRFDLLDAVAMYTMAVVVGGGIRLTWVAVVVGGGIRLTQVYTYCIVHRHCA